MEKKFAIKGQGKNIFWSNEFGWVEVRDGCPEVWTESEKENLFLPMGGQWREVLVDY